MWNYGFGYWGFPFFPFFWLVIWIIVIMYIFGGKRRWTKHHDAHSNKSAEEILAERFANGEIDEEEYDHRLEVLKKHNK